jgi:hypothetical protein
MRKKIGPKSKFPVQVGGSEAVIGGIQLLRVLGVRSLAILAKSKGVDVGDVMSM